MTYRERIQALLAGIILLATPAFPQARNLAVMPQGFELVQNPVPTNMVGRAYRSVAGELAPGSNLQLGAPPESEPTGGLISRTMRRFGEDQKDVFLAPFRVHNLKWDALFVGGTGALVVGDESASRHLPKTSAYISQDISNATIATTAIVVGSTWIYGLKTGNAHARETGELTLETLANTFTVYTAMQVLAGRERPYQGSGEGSFFRNHSVNTSFPGGHAMFTWAMAGIVAHEYPHPLVKILAYGAATAVAGSRFTARQHFLSDVAVGSALGYLVSREIFYTRCKVGLGSACHHHKDD